MKQAVYAADWSLVGFACGPVEAALMKRFINVDLAPSPIVVNEGQVEHLLSMRRTMNSAATLR